MISLTYNPFLVDSLDDITAVDLGVLRDAAEGWYLEYKAEQVTSNSISKSISSFANHYGGWIFYGIEEATDGSLTAGAFPGIATTDVATFLERIKHAVKDSIYPSPFYEHTVIDGPEPSIGLPTRYSIIILAVPIGPDAPYVHRNGRIYRRVADSSDPVHETDRLILDQLWNRREKARRNLETFLMQRPELSKGEVELPYVDVLFLPDPLGASGQNTKLSFRDFVGVMTESHDEWMAKLQFDNFYSMSGGYVARAISTNDPYNLTPTWRHYRNGWSAISVPLSSADIDSLLTSGWLHGYDYAFPFAERALQQRLGSSRVIDLNQFMAALLGLMNYQVQLMTVGGINGPLSAKTVLCNVWRKVPFLDTKPYFDFVGEFGLPLIQTDEVISPPGTTFESLIDLQELGELDPDATLESQVRLFASLLGHLFAGFGLPPLEMLDNEVGWLDAAFRSIKVQDARARKDA